MRYPWAVPGRKVVCVNMSNPEGRRVYAPALPVEGQVYVIGSTCPSMYDMYGLNLRLVGYPNIWGGEDIGYAAWRFRPLHTIGDDVALFAELLTPAPNAPMLPETTE